MFVVGGGPGGMGGPPINKRFLPSPEILVRPRCREELENEIKAPRHCDEEVEAAQRAPDTITRAPIGPSAYISRTIQRLKSYPIYSMSSSEPAPSSLSARRLLPPVLLSKDGTSLTLSWSPPDGSVIDLLGYRLRWRRAASDPWTPLLADDRLLSGTQVRKKNLIEAQEYFFSVLPVFSGDQGFGFEWSDTSSALVPCKPPLCLLPDDANFTSAHCTESSGRPLHMILDYMRFTIYRHSLARKLLKPEFKRPRGQFMSFNEFLEIIEKNRQAYYTDIAILTGLVFTHWNKLGASDADIVSELREFAEVNPALGLGPLISQDVVFWHATRKRGTFVVLLGRPDGTVFISEAAKEVYLVQGIASSIHKKLRADAEGVINVRVECTLLCWQGRIVYDGTMVVEGSQGAPPPSDPSRRQRVLDMYHAAVAAGTVITTLAKVEERLPERLPATADVVTALRRELAVELLSLGRAPTLPALKRDFPDFWVFRRLGYTEAENPAHVLAVMGNEGSIVEMFTPMSALVPTAKDIVGLMCRIVSRIKSKPGVVMVDAIEIVDVLTAVLAGTGVDVQYYPPPSQEETKTTDMALGMKECGHCEQKRVSMLKCGSCKAVHYCDQSCQKAHWGIHKAQCGT